MQPQIRNKQEIGSVAQLNRASDYGSEGYGFESHRSHIIKRGYCFSIFSFFVMCILTTYIIQDTEIQQHSNFQIKLHTSISCYFLNQSYRLTDLVNSKQFIDFFDFIFIKPFLKTLFCLFLYIWLNIAPHLTQYKYQHSHIIA